MAAHDRSMDPCFASADPSITGSGCTLRRVLDAIGGKWKKWLGTYSIVRHHEL